MFTILNGGKALASKVRYTRFYLIMDINPDDKDIDALELYYSVAAAIKKGLNGTKLGEAGFRPGPSGSYFNAFDTVNDSFKLLEEAINTVGCNKEDRKFLTIGINCDSNTYYMAEQEKYDIEGPKNLFDSTMLADYWVKMAKDHPLLTYIEDPFAEGDVRGYQKLIKKL
jgi:enolase